VARGDIWQATLSGRNDLEPIAAGICPAITDILDVLTRANPAIVRMSGSGATCFALFNEAKDLEAAKALLDPLWWSMGTALR
jgi:4-diphosphocytidyl-2-C-methyl-D-erythritol kinase